MELKTLSYDTFIHIVRIVIKTKQYELLNKLCQTSKKTNDAIKIFTPEILKNINIIIEGEYLCILKTLYNNKSINSDKKTSIINYALKNNKKAILKLLFTEGINPNCLIDGFSLLHRAVYYNNFIMVEFLLENEVSPNSKNEVKYNKLNRYDTPLLLAIYQKSYTIVELLLKYDADPNLGDIDNFTPLFYAVKNYIKSSNENDLNVIISLIEKGGDPSIRDYDIGLTPIKLMFEYDNINLFHLLYNYNLIDLSDVPYDEIDSEGEIASFLNFELEEN
jgi:ankyrin repeat protein